MSKHLTQPMNNSIPIIQNNEINYEQLQQQATLILKGTHYLNSLSLAEAQGSIKGGRRNVEASLLTGAGADTSRQDKQTQRREQEERLKQYAQHTGIWIDQQEIDNWQEVGAGMESRVYYKNGYVYKVGYNYLNFYDTPDEFFTNKITLHNYLFPEVPYQLMGFTETYGAYRETKGSFFAPVYRQVFVQGNELSELPHTAYNEFVNYMTNAGFVQDNNCFVSKDYIIKDLHKGNIFVSAKGNYFFIDTVPLLNTPAEKLGGKRTYGYGNLILSHKSK